MFPASLICKQTKPSHRIKVGRRPIFYVQPQTDQNILKPANRIQKTTDKPWSKNNRLDLYRSTPSFLHYIEEGFSLSTIKQIFNAEKHRYTTIKQ